MPLIFNQRRWISPSQAFGGIAKIDWSHPILNGISYLEIFNKFDALGGQSDFIDNGKIIVAQNGAQIGVVAGGIGLTTNCLSDASTSTYNVPTPKGSLFAYVTATWAPTDGNYHSIAFIGINGSHALYLDKVGGNNWNFGWDGNGSASASGTFNAGDSFSVGCTWSNVADAIPSYENLYVKGILSGTYNSSPSTSATSGNGVLIGGLGANTWLWDTNGQSAIHYLATWSRVLQPEEIQLLANDPWCFVITAEGEMPALKGASAASAVVFRRTLSQVGTRVGSRQSQGWN